MVNSGQRSSQTASNNEQLVEQLEQCVRTFTRLIVNTVIQEIKGYPVVASEQPENMFPEIKGPSTQTQKLTFSVEEAGKLLGLSRATIYEAIKQGQVPSIRFGRRILIPRAAVTDCWLK